MGGEEMEGAGDRHGMEGVAEKCRYWRRAVEDVSDG